MTGTSSVTSPPRLGNHPERGTAQSKPSEAATAPDGAAAAGKGSNTGDLDVAAVQTPAPSVFSVETTLLCDLSCPECAIGGGLIRRDKGAMDLTQYQVIADKIRGYAKYVYLHVWGDPLLNPHIFEIIRCTATFAGTNISTNAQSLTREKAEALVSSGVSDVIVSIDGVTQEVYQKYRVGGDVEKAFSALALLAEANRRAGSKVNIIPQFIVFAHNQHEMGHFRERCAQLGLSPAFKAPYIRHSDSRFAFCGNPSYRRPRFADLGSLQSAMSACPNPREVFTVLKDGSVVACCHDYAGATTFGNIFEKEVLEIWHSPAFYSFRDAVSGGRAPEFCIESCMTWSLDHRPPAQVPHLVNLCCGAVLIPGFVNIDAMPGAELHLDLEHELLPFPDQSVDALVCISAINYFSYERGREIVADVYRVLKPGGIARFATQDLRILARRYLERDASFFFQTVPGGRDRFPGETFCDKLNHFFYGFYAGEKHCKYVYDPESLARHFKEAGFTRIEEKSCLDSAIPGAERFDNRPEQMFFLEAVKEEAPESRYLEILRQKEEALPGRAAEDPVRMREHALALMRENRERGWQLLLKALELNPADREGTLACAAVLEQMERFGDLFQLCGAYSRAVPGAPFAEEAQRAYRLARTQEAASARAAEKMRPAVARLEQRLNRVLSDREHLEAAAAWLRRAQSVTATGGVAASYQIMQQRWDTAYPETTGYIIPTMLACSRLTGNPLFRECALRMGEWEIDIQAPEGGAGEPYGVYGLRPRVFNTGQVLLGFVSLYRETGRREFLEAAMRAGDWIVGCLDPDGKWSRGTYRGPRSYKSRVAWALLELHELCGKSNYREAARRAVGWVLCNARENGFFTQNSLGDPDRPWTHLIGYVLVGLLEACRFPEMRSERERALPLLRNAAQALSSEYLARRERAAGGLTLFPATFDSRWQSRDDWSCVTGTAQIEFFLRRMLPHLDVPGLPQAADGMLEDLKRLQLIDGIESGDLFGALPGAYPFGAPYCPNSLPNWGVKFFADSLLQRMLPADLLDCLG